MDALFRLIIAETASDEVTDEKQANEEKPKHEEEACSGNGESEMVDEPPLGWDAGAEQVKEMGWGDLPPTNAQAQGASDNGASSWANSSEQAAEKPQNTDSTSASRAKSGRRGNGRRPKYTDVTDQLGFMAETQYDEKGTSEGKAVLGCAFHDSRICTCIVYAASVLFVFVVGPAVSGWRQ
ncbi:unnamed protein product [Toxocara canis]|uniref:Eukaryotic/viral aspartic protease n=1 Tax=Toxocara canis TaxID=6265 RepID=A0A183UEZ1_TOXCA|nr:unnamed protein product [Toxocara canis]